MSGSRMAEPSVGGRVYAHTRSCPERGTWTNMGDGVWQDEHGCKSTWEDLEDPSPI